MSSSYSERELGHGKREGGFEVTDMIFTSAEKNVDRILGDDANRIRA